MQQSYRLSLACNSTIYKLMLNWVLKNCGTKCYTSLVWINFQTLNLYLTFLYPISFYPPYIQLWNIPKAGVMGFMSAIEFSTLFGANELSCCTLPLNKVEICTMLRQ